METDAKQVLVAAGVPDFTETVSIRWPDSVDSMPVRGPAELVPGEIERYVQVSGIDEDDDPAWGPGLREKLLKTAGRIRESSALTLLFWHAVQTCYSYLDVSWFAMARWPRLEAALGEDHALFYLLVGLAMVPRTEVKHRELGIPEDVSRQTLRGPVSFLRRFRDGNEGRPGMFQRDVGWLRHSTEGELFRLGRFEYMLKVYDDPFHGFRDTRSGSVVLLAQDGSTFTGEGFVAGHDAAQDAGAWRAAFRRDGSAVRGYPIDPHGFAVPRSIELDESRWAEVLTPKRSLIMDVHIPVGGGMTPDAVRSSFESAVEFFTHYRPDTPMAGFRCQSWIFGPQLATVLPPESNLVRLLHEVYLFPVPTHRSDGLFFIYSDSSLGDDIADPARISALPTRTSLQARVKAHLLAGGAWRGGGMVFLIDDLERFGSGVYQTSDPMHIFG